MILLAPEDRAHVYTVDSEGTLYSMPINSDGSINFNDIIEVECVDELDDENVNEIHEKLISMMKAVGWYFQN